MPASTSRCTRARPEAERRGPGAGYRRGVLGAPVETAGASYWADAAFLAAAGIPTVLLGPTGAGAHAVEEWVSVSSCGQVAAILVETARRVCAVAE